MRWARMRWLWWQTEADRFSKEISSLVAFFKAQKGDATDFEKPAIEPKPFFYVYALKNSPTNNVSHMEKCWGGPDF
jgi:hypothetical protein